MATFALIHGAGTAAGPGTCWRRSCAGGATTSWRRTCPARDDIALYMHDVPPELAAEALRRARDQSATPGKQPWPLAAWPKVATRFLVCRDDRFFPAEFLHRVARERLGITADEIDGSHCVALSPAPRTWPTAWRRTGPSS